MMFDSIWGSQPRKKKRAASDGGLNGSIWESSDGKKKQNDLFSGLNTGIYGNAKRSKKQENILGGRLNFSLGNDQRKEVERDYRRTFNQTQKNEIWAQQNGRCASCHNRLDPRTTEYDHVKPWADKGKTIVVNGAGLCANCHKLKSHSDRIKKVDKKRHQKEDTNSFGLPKFKF